MQKNMEKTEKSNHVKLARKLFKRNIAKDLKKGGVTYMDFLSYKTIQRNPLNQKISKKFKKMGLVDKLHLVNNEMAYQCVQNDDQIKFNHYSNIRKQNRMNGRRFLDNKFTKEIIKLRKTEPARKGMLKRLERELVQEKVDKIWKKIQTRKFSKNVSLKN